MNIHPPLRFLAVICLMAAAFAQGPVVPKPPATPKRPVTDEYGTVKVTDDYRWLENWDDPEVKQWSAAQNVRTREYFDHLPARPAIKDRLAQLIKASSGRYYDLQFRGETLFAMKFQPPKQQPMLVAMRSPDDPGSEKVVFDPNAASSKGSVAVDFYVPSLDGKYVAAALSENGSEDASGHVFEVASGKELADDVSRVNFATAGGSIDWKADDSGFYYTRYPQGSERPPEDANFYQQVYFHKLGANAKEDSYVIGKDFPRIAEIQLHTSEDGRWLIAAVANGDGGQFAHYLMDASGKWTQLTHFEDGVVSVKVGFDSDLYLLSRKDAPRGQILRLPLSKLELSKARIFVAQTPGSSTDENARAAIQNFVPTPGRLYVVDIIGGPSRVRVFDGQGGSLPGPSLPPISAVGQVVSVGGGDVLFYTSTYLQPPAWYAFAPPRVSPRAPRFSILRRSSSTMPKSCVVLASPKMARASQLTSFAVKGRSSTAAIQPCSMATADTESASSRSSLGPRRGSGSTRAEFTHWLTFAAGANTGKSGTRKAILLTSRMSSTILLPAPNT